jgi:hypothetical protein
MPGPCLTRNESGLAALRGLRDRLEASRPHRWTAAVVLRDHLGDGPVTVTDPSALIGYVVATRRHAAANYG